MKSTKFKKGFPVSCTTDFVSLVLFLV